MTMSKVTMQENTNLDRFIQAQDIRYKAVIDELKAGQKMSHWIWYIFPQISGISDTELSERFAIEDIEEAEQYLANPILSKRLYQCAELIFENSGACITDILGSPDDQKFFSSMTLFHLASKKSDSIFSKNLTKYFSAKLDHKTLDELKVF